MAHSSSIDLMIRQADAAPGAGRDFAAVYADHASARAAAVQEQDALLPSVAGILQRLQQRSADTRGVAAANFLLQVYHLHRRQPPAVVPAGQPE